MRRSALQRLSSSRKTNRLKFDGPSLANGIAERCESKERRNPRANENAMKNNHPDEDKNNEIV